MHSEGQWSKVKSQRSKNNDELSFAKYDNSCQSVKIIDPFHASLYTFAQKHAEMEESQKRIDNTRVDADEVIEGIISQQNFSKDETSGGKKLILLKVGCRKVGQFCQLKLCWIGTKMWTSFFACKEFSTFYKMWSSCQFEITLVS